MLEHGCDAGMSTVTVVVHDVSGSGVVLFQVC